MIVVFHSQLNFDATALRFHLKLSGTSCSCRLSSCWVTWANAGEEDTTRNLEVSATIRTWRPPSVSMRL